MTYVFRAGLLVASELADFIEQEALPGSGLNADDFWPQSAALFARFTPENEALLARRDDLQASIDAWFSTRQGRAPDPAEYESFLRQIGYLEAEPDPFRVATENVDVEICAMAGPQLVVPALNARYLLNAANARWGSLYDALYGTDAIPGEAAPGGFDPERGRQVVAAGRAFLDQALPLKAGSWADASGDLPELADPSCFAGVNGKQVLYRHHGLHIELTIDASHMIGKDDPLAIADIRLEAALSTIVDLEDSVAAVDAQDKVLGYRNWLQLLRGELEAQFEKGGRMVTRRLAADHSYQDEQGKPFALPGRSLLLVRNVGHLMTTPALMLPDGKEAPEGILDAIVTCLCGKHDLLGHGPHRNSRKGAIYVVKPKMHGSAEADFTARLYGAVEELLGLAPDTVKIGLMDEERRTSANLAACIHALKNRLFFINTGFLDRTGDELHSSMLAGPMLSKGEMKSSAWLQAYEGRNVAIGLACGLSGRCQIGKGMWAAPDRMADMLEQKIGHVQAGANTAWVPSPTAAVLHATHYHQLDVFARQKEIAGQPVPGLGELLAIPLADTSALSADVIDREVQGNAQSILGYVVRWVDQGIGCSKVPDINDIGLMEDRATLRISSQSLANWLAQGVITRDQVLRAFAKMAAIVDRQNAEDPAYRKISGNERQSLAFQASLALVFEGLQQPNGYTEPVLHRFRALAKQLAQD